LASEDILLLGVALIIGLNRLYAHTALRSFRLAYAAIQGINLFTCILLFVCRLEDIDPRLDAAVRLFLIAFVTWHMALNYRANGRLAHARAADERSEEDDDELQGGATGVDVRAGDSVVLSDDGEDL